ncbi:hypothetical protein R4227_22285 [Gordonia amicalis]|uniref:hypothetical protein n=1 Tax=Gordonia amicalis TaxID=89053 RepID=UPI0029555897|nr:hypothetical protein [Gordonia amicalis]MDV7102748.1 hypothetical protein [Gordonia amicalis]
MSPVNPETVDTDVVVGAVVAQEPTRIWSLTDLFYRLREDLHLERIRDSVEELVAFGYLEELASVGCDDLGCTDPLCGDLLMRVRVE